MPSQPSDRRVRRYFRSDLWIAVLPTALIVAAAFAVTLIFVKPAPPKRLTIAIAADEGGARYYARRYQEILKRHGVTLDVRQTTGSPANIKLLADGSSGVDVAIVQTGSNGSEQAPDVVSLGSVAYVPLWVFYRGEPTEDVRDLGGRRIAVGGPESGTRALALKLLAAAGVDKPPTTLLSVERDAAAEQLKRGEIDAAFLVSPAEAPMIKKLVAAPGIRLLSFARADAYVRIFPALSRLTLPRGVFDLANDIPERDEVLISPTANLLAKDSLHPALAYLLLRAASEVHSSAGLLDRANEFPAPRESGFPLSPEARRYYQVGVPFLQRYLPFWAANMVDRLWVMLVPIIAVMVPLGRIVPAAYRWRVRSRVFRWYANLKEIELQLEDGERHDLHEMLQRLDETERAVKAIRMPLSYAENLYFFRMHVEVVRRRILRRLREEQPPPAS
ncbi:MAG TPA: TAXI family TRAP transporter solute-binding subunit [Myxococcales bacterium]|nr:TAXI family TRAP transporter solute-binding subunit [Myxococcales bacterium]